MRAAIRLAGSILLSIAIAGCSTLAPSPSIHINGDSTMSVDDMREIQRLLPSLGIDHAITMITMSGPDYAVVYCETRPPAWGNITDGGDGIEFTVIRKRGRWSPVGRPRKSGRVIICA